MPRINEPAPEDETSDLLATADPTAYNVEAIARLEHEALLQRTASERFSDKITKYVGSMAYVVLHAVVFAVWALVNLGLVPGVTPFDPFPFGILTLIVSAEGVFIAIFILISQNRMSRHADRRAHLSLQVSMLAEQELTLLLRMQQSLCDKFGIDVHRIKAEADRLMDETDVEVLVEDLEEKLPSD